MYFRLDWPLLYLVRGGSMYYWSTNVQCDPFWTSWKSLLTLLLTLKFCCLFLVVPEIYDHEAAYLDISFQQKILMFQMVLTKLNYLSPRLIPYLPTWPYILPPSSEHPLALVIHMDTALEQSPFAQSPVITKLVTQRQRLTTAACIGLKMAFEAVQGFRRCTEFAK